MRMVISNSTWFLFFFWILHISKLQACICPKEWKSGWPGSICGKEITAITNDHSCEPQFVYDCTEFGGVAVPFRGNCTEAAHQFCEIYLSRKCHTEECCREERRIRYCADAVQRLPNRHLSLEKPGQYNPVSASQYPAVRENVFATCLKDYHTNVPSPENAEPAKR